MVDTHAPRRSSSAFRWIVGLLFAALLGWLAAGTEWSLVFDKDALLRGIEIEDAQVGEGGACEATIDVDSLPARPTRVSITRESGSEPIAMESGRGAITYPADGDSVALRLTYEGVLRKPSHADVTLAQRGCQLAPSSFQSMPLLPF